MRRAHAECRLLAMSRAQRRARPGRAPRPCPGRHERIEQARPRAVPTRFERPLRFVAAFRPSVARAEAASALAVLLVGLRAKFRVLLAELARRVDRREVFVREELANLERAALGGRRATHPGDRLVERLHLDDGEARDEL